MKQENPSRRIVLRAALMVGCGLWVPVVLTGCDSKKGSTPATGTPDAKPAPGSQPVAPATSTKAPQASVKYQGQPNGDQRCGTCVNFIAESSTCKVVDGQISPTGWCTLWIMKA
jgi:hypothetical protein